MRHYFHNTLSPGLGLDAKSFQNGAADGQTQIGRHSIHLRFWLAGIIERGGCPTQCPTNSEGEDMTPKRTLGLMIAAAALRLAKRPGVLDRRRETVEHPFGTIKQWMCQGAFLMRGLEKVRAEFSLTALAYNLRRVLNMVGFTDLMAALAA
jgi:hypothetical protein